ncbi:MAG: RDD family protein [Syntrophaceae bacterium]|nr:RDD family protein [Syntrophaceae bacterium]
MTVYKFAGFWRRFVAYAVDNIIINIVFFIFGVIVATAFVMGSMSADNLAWIADITDPAHITPITLLIAAWYVILTIAYFTYFHGMKGRTPGKMLMGLQVVSTDGTPIGFGTAFLRSVGYLVSSLLFTIPLGFIWVAFDKKKQGWHDKIAGTVVIIRSDENVAAGLNITEPAAISNALQTEERKTATGTEAEINDQPEDGDQKIP